MMLQLICNKNPKRCSHKINMLEARTPPGNGSHRIGLGTGTGITGSERGAWYPRGWHGDEHLLVHVMCYGVLSACRRRCPPAAFLVLQLQRQHRNIATSQQHGQVYIIRKLAHMLPPPHHFLSLSSSQPLNRFHIQFSVVQTSSSCRL